MDLPGEGEMIQLCREVGDMPRRMAARTVGTAGQAARGLVLLPRAPSSLGYGYLYLYQFGIYRAELGPTLCPFIPCVLRNHGHWGKAFNPSGTFRHAEAPPTWHPPVRWLSRDWAV